MSGVSERMYRGYLIREYSDDVGRVEIYGRTYHGLTFWEYVSDATSVEVAKEIIDGYHNAP